MKFKKFGLILLTLITISSLMYAESIPVLSGEKMEICLLNSFRQTKSDANLSEYVAAFKGKNYNLSLWGIGLRYYPLKKIFLELSSQSIEKKTTIGTATTGPGWITNLQLPEFKITTFSFNYLFSIKDGLDILSIFGMSYVNAMEEREGVGENHRAYSSTWLIGTLDVLHRDDFKNKINYVRSPGNELNVDINPVSIETVFSLYF